MEYVHIMTTVILDIKFHAIVYSHVITMITINSHVIMFTCYYVAVCFLYCLNCC